MAMELLQVQVEHFIAVEHSSDSGLDLTLQPSSGAGSANEARVLVSVVDGGEHSITPCLLVSIDDSRASVRCCDVSGEEVDTYEGFNHSAFKVSPSFLPSFLPPFTRYGYNKRVL